MLLCIIAFLLYNSTVKTTDRELWVSLLSRFLSQDIFYPHLRSRENVEMILTLPSNALMNTFPENKANHFKVELLKELDLSDGEYEVGLMEINFPHDFQRRYTYLSGETIRLRYSETEYEHFRIPEVKYTGPIDLFRKFCLTHAYAWELEDYKFGFARVRLEENSRFFQRIRDMIDVPNGNFYELMGEELNQVVRTAQYFKFDRCFLSSSGKPGITFLSGVGDHLTLPVF